MKRDTHLTFGEIHGDEQTLKSSMQDIEELALTKMSTRQRMPLRFLTPLEGDWLKYLKVSPEDDNVHLLLTEPMEAAGEAYVSVSYTWQHLEPTVDQRLVPSYLIYDAAWPDGSARAPRCPGIVLQRALRFAQREKCPYIWIDQECIDQDDALDIENHLQVMHWIYAWSKHTAAVLSFHIKDQQELDFLKHFTSYALYNLPRDPQSLAALTDLFDRLSKDQWFTRTWTFHERHRASSLCLLIPCEVGGWEGRDITLTTHALHCGYEWMENCPDISPQLSHIYRTHFTVTTWSIESLGVVFDAMQACDNLVFSDRLAIYANIFDFTKKLRTTLLQDTNYSYSTCMLLLVKNNMKEEDWGTLCHRLSFANCTIGDILRLLDGGRNMIYIRERELKALDSLRVRKDAEELVWDVPPPLERVPKTSFLSKYDQLGFFY